MRPAPGATAGAAGPSAPAGGGWVPASQFLRTPVQAGPRDVPGATPPAAATSSSAAHRPTAAAAPADASGAGRLALGTSVAATRTSAPATFGCPSCGTTIAKGSRRCQACGQRLLADVPARKATALVGGGLLAGLIAGGLIVGVALPRDTATAGGGTGGSGAAATLIPVPGNAAAALRGTVTLNGRLAGEAEPLAAALAETTFDTAEVVRILRRMSSDLRAASAMVPSLGGWPEAADHQAALDKFYGKLTDQINGALAASVTSEGSYRASTTEILDTLRQIATLDDEARQLANGTTVQLPVVEIPPTLR